MLFRSTKNITIGGFQKFRRIRIDDKNVTEFIDVFDSLGNRYFEVEYLTQDIIYKSEINTDPDTKQQTPNLLIPISVPRRFIIERDQTSTYMVLDTDLKLILQAYQILNQNT